MESEMPRASFDLSDELLAELRAVAHDQRKTLSQIAERALSKEVRYMKKHPPTRLKPGLRKGRPLTRPDRSRKPER